MHFLLIGAICFRFTFCGTAAVAVGLSKKNCNPNLVHCCAQWDPIICTAILYLNIPVVVGSSLSDKYVLRWDNISIFLVTYVVSAMCHSGKSCAGAVEDNDNAKHTVTRPFGVVTITFFSFFFFKVRRQFAPGFACNQSWIAEFGLITAGSGEKRIHRNDGFQFRFWCQNRPILSTVFYPIVRQQFTSISVYGKLFSALPRACATL